MRSIPLRYWPEDVWFFVNGSPYVTLGKRRSATRFLLPQVEAAEECHEALSGFQTVQIPHLAFSYTCLRSLVMCDPAFFSGLLSECNWRGVAWGAWLAILEPRSFMLPELTAAAPRFPIDPWLIRCAISVIEGAPAPEDAELLALATRLRQALRPVLPPALPIRLVPDDVLIEHIEREREVVRAVYRSRGLDAARDAARGTLAAEYALDYREWIRLAPELRRAPHHVPVIAP